MYTNGTTVEADFIPNTLLIFSPFRASFIFSDSCRNARFENWKENKIKINVRQTRKILGLFPNALSVKGQFEHFSSNCF